VSADTDPVAARLARWEERDAAIGLAAELEQSRSLVAERDREIVALRERGERLAQRVAQLTTERDGLQRKIDALQRPTFAARAQGKARRIVGRALRG